MSIPGIDFTIAAAAIAEIGSPLMVISPNMVINICERFLFRQLIQLLLESQTNSGSFTRELRPRKVTKRQ